MIAAVSWVPKGVAKSVPSVADPPSKKQIEELIEASDLERSGEDSGSEEDDQEMDVDAAKQTGEELDMDNYDDEDDGIELFSTGLGDLYHPSNSMDRYIKGEDGDDSENLEDMAVKPKDAVWILDETSDGDSNIYVHHEVPLSTFPICTTWLDCPLKGGEKGNFIAVGSMEPAIEIWNLDIIDEVQPAVVLGGIEEKKKKKKGKKVYSRVPLMFFAPFIVVAQKVKEAEITQGQQDSLLLVVAQKVKEAEITQGQQDSLLLVVAQKVKEAEITQGQQDSLLLVYISQQLTIQGIMIAAVSWVPKGVAKSVPSVADPPSKEEIEELIKASDLERSGEDSGSEEDDQEMDVDAAKQTSEVSQALAVANAHGRSSKVNKSETKFDDLADGLQELDMDNYDDEDDENKRVIGRQAGLVWEVSLEDGTVQGFDIRAAKSGSASDLKPSFTLHAHDKAVCTISYNPLTSNLLATGSTDKMVKLWDLSNNQPSCLVSKNPKAGAIFSVSFSEDNPFLLAIGGSKGTLELWDTLSEAEVARRFGTTTS
ncbi:hypothetical protein POTOM_027183 [Populus tomentosa]|uniref:Transducin/WD40 repeat-like superfamily protein n=1 Tax=Populus tomentosa TaxID=118781 RepID=A0A8X7ZI67_POPTO|nr:hypothetical protein POTOM_027183 [Populus tomentosa]